MIKAKSTHFDAGTFSFITYNVCCLSMVLVILFERNQRLSENNNVPSEESLATIKTYAAPFNIIGFFSQDSSFKELMLWPLSYLEMPVGGNLNMFIFLGTNC